MFPKSCNSSDNNGSVRVTSAGWRRWRRLWRGWIVIPTGIGVSVFTVLQWRRLNWGNQSPNENVPKNFRITCYRAIPLRAMSRAWGWLSSQHVPLSLRCWLYSRYANMYGVNLEEAAYSLENYNSLCEFFIRPLKQGVRPVDEFEPIVSPADGSIINVGVVNSCNVEQIKGVTYTIKAFLGEPTWNANAVEHNHAPSLMPNCTSSDKEIISYNDKTIKTSSKYLKYKTDNVISKLENEGCELIHLDINDEYKCKNKISANFRYDSRMLGWLVFYFHFCIKDLLINSFYFGFQIIYGIKSSFVLSNGKISKGASFLKSQLSYSSDSTSGFNTKIEATASSGLSYESDSNDSDGEESDRCYDPDWQKYKKTLLHNHDNELYQFVVYLAPGDYHSVHPKVAKWIPELFSLNERAVYVGEWQHGFFSMVAVGATNVGSIKVHSDKELITNTRRWKNSPRFIDKVLNTSWKKGEEIGEFRLGSTIVLLFEAPKNFLFNVEPGQKIKVGEAVTKLIDNEA
ncbi:hypothetical protein PGB90_002426 [Kerria lacca]